MTAFTHELVVHASALLDARIGLKSEPSFQPRLARALRDVARARQLDATRLMAGMAIEGPILDDVVDHITVQESAFFRHPEHFLTLADTLLPQISGPVHVWSAASANGQEPYSVAMILREQGRVGSVLATDVSPAAIRRTTQAVYDERELRGVSARRLQQYFASDGADGRRRVQSVLRDVVVPRQHNLLRPIPDEVGQCQIVFCRNVLIYFTAAHATRFLERLADAMAPGAYLIVGSAEAIWHINDRFEPQHLGSCYVFRPRPRQLTATPQKTTARLAADRSIPAGGPAAAPPAGATRTARRSAAIPDVPTPSETSRVGVAPIRIGAGAVVEFRRWAYSSPDDPLAHFHLGTALDESGHPVAARRAFRAALAALDRMDPGALDHALGGYQSGELRRLVTARTRPAGRDRADRSVNTGGRGAVR